jgi:hypothetical protein
MKDSSGALIAILLVPVLHAFGQESRTNEAGDAKRQDTDQQAVAPSDIVLAEDSGVVFSGEIETQGDSGAEYVFVATELVFPKDSRAFGDAMMKGTGQFLHYEGTDVLLLTGGKVTSKAGDKIVLQLPEQQVEFQIGNESCVCDGNGPIALGEVAAGDLVVVVSRPGNVGAALSVRKGPMLLKTGGPFGSAKASVPVNYRCKFTLDEGRSGRKATKSESAPGPDKVVETISRKLSQLRTGRLPGLHAGTRLMPTYDFGDESPRAFQGTKPEDLLGFAVLFKGEWGGWGENDVVFRDGMVGTCPAIAIYVREGTKAKVQDKVYVYESGKWRWHAEEDPQ